MQCRRLRYISPKGSICALGVWSMPVLLCTNKGTVTFFMMVEVGRTQHALHQDCTVMLNVSIRDRPCTRTVLTSEIRLAPGLYSDAERQCQRHALHRDCTDSNTERQRYALHQNCTVMLNVSVRDMPCTGTVLTVILNVRDTLCTRTVQ